MKNVSNAFYKTMMERTDFYCDVQIIFTDGTQKQLGKGDFTISGNSIVESSDSSSFPLGTLVPKQITLSIINDDGQWESYSFIGAKILLKTKFDLNNGTTESINVGTFTVISPETYGTVVEVTAMDDCYKMDCDYDTTLSYPVSIGVAVRDSCLTCGVTLLDTDFPNNDYEIPEKPENLTHRQFIGLCAMIAGGNARMDEYNRLHIIPYDFSGFEGITGLDGGQLDSANQLVYETGDDADGGTFIPWNVGYKCDSGDFTTMDQMHVLYDFKSGMTMETDDVVITGVQMTDEDDNVYLYGTEGYVLSLENELAVGNEAQVVKRIGQKIVGLQFRPFTADYIAYPLAEFMDLVYIVGRNGECYKSVITDIDFQYYGFTTLKCSADIPIRNSSKYYGNETKTIIAARKNAKKQISEYDKAVQMLTNLMTQSFGIFKTVEVLEDGSAICYLHNKPELAQSETVWKMTADAFAVSTDGGRTWKAGMDSSGNAVVNVLSAIGVNFDWANGGTLTLGGADNKNGVLKILNASGNQIGKWDKDGISATTGTFSGTLSAATGTFKGVLSGATGTFSGTLSAATGTFKGVLSGATGTFSGALSAATGTFSGELSAATGTFKGSIISDNGNTYTQISNGRMMGGVSGKDVTGYVSFNAYYKSTGIYGLRLMGQGIIALGTPYLGVGDFVDPGQDCNVSIGLSGSVDVVSSLSIENNSSGGISWSYGFKTLSFTKGLMTMMV